MAYYRLFTPLCLELDHKTFNRMMASLVTWPLCGCWWPNRIDREEVGISKAAAIAALKPCGFSC